MTRRLLLVEDEEDSRLLLQDALTSRGFVVDGAATRPEALALARASVRFDAIVTDVVLGSEEYGGLTLVQELRDSGIAPPFIVITAFADKPRLKRALELRVAYLLEKPFSTDELVSVLRRVWEEADDLSHFVEQALAQAHLTPKETEIARLVLKGLSNDEIARILNNSSKTVRQHLSSIYQKAKVTSRSEFFHYVFPS